MPGVGLWLQCRAGRPKGSGGPHATVVTQGGTWAWPNSLETVFLIVLDSSWMVVGHSVEVDDGAHSGTLTVDAVGEEFVTFGWTPVGPDGGTEMLDGAAVREV